MSSYPEAVNYIFDLPRFTTKHTFEEGRLFLEKLGNPDLGLNVIHVAGTNGKGSVCAYMESILMHSGRSVGCFISPHLNDIRERIRIDGKMCDEARFADAFDRVFEASRDLFVPTFFEYLFYMAMLIYADVRPDIVILETGLGGRLDATNLIGDKLGCVITSIGYDHCEYLGDTIDEIAFEKAHIARPGRPLIYRADGPGAGVISRIAHDTQSVEIALYGDIISDIHRDNSDIDFCLEYKYDKFICPHLKGHALFQVENAALAVRTLMSIPELDGTISDDDILHGLYDTYWPARMEEISAGIILDGAHNEPAIRAFIESVASDRAQKRMLIFGCMRDKAYMREIGLLTESGLFNRIVAVDIDSPRAESAEIIAEAFRNAGAEDVNFGHDLRRVLDEARRAVDQDGIRVYIAGSLYLAGEVRGLMLC